METTYLIDTNILVYAYNEDAEFHEKAFQKYKRNKSS